MLNKRWGEGRGRREEEEEVHREVGRTQEGEGRPMQDIRTARAPSASCPPPHFPKQELPGANAGIRPLTQA